MSGPVEPARGLGAANGEERGRGQALVFDGRLGQGAIGRVWRMLTPSAGML